VKVIASIALAIVMWGIIFGEDHFRYFCQDPKNWDAARCQRPECATRGTCPDQLVNTKELKGE
jgi:hypothetical protein